jgi:hypothetical protein
MPLKLRVVSPPPNPKLARLVEDYVDDCRARGLSPGTVGDNYGYPLRVVFLPWAGREQISEPGQLNLLESYARISHANS